MKKFTALLLWILAASGALRAQPPPPTIKTGGDPIAIGTCVDIVNVGNIYVRSQNPNIAPIGVFRCTQTGNISTLGAGAFTWQPIDHLVVSTLPLTCTIGDLAFKSSDPAGVNLYGCTSLNVWTSLGGINGTGVPDGKYCVQVLSGVASLTQTACPGNGGGTLFDSATGLFDSASGLFDSH